MIYYRQDGGNDGALVALYNFVKLNGKEPNVFPNTEEWTKLLTTCCCTNTGELMNIQPALSEFRIEVKDIPLFRSLTHLKRHIIHGVKKGICYLMVVHKGGGQFHTFLISGYDKNKKIFTTINGLFHHTKNPIEYVEWEEITAHMFKASAGEESYNVKEGTSFYAKKTFGLTKSLELWSEDRIF